MRGQVFTFNMNNEEVRITPADAGTRDFGKLVVRLVWDHPRGCGDKFHTFNDSREIHGSPPRMRGQGRKASNF